ncbi:MAG: hypothetical protein R6V32_11670, partial [Bacteroidales bacterium]
MITYSDSGKRTCKIHFDRNRNGLLSCCLAVMFFLFSQISVLAANEAIISNSTADITMLYVDPVNGLDSNPGSKEKPFMTIERARDEIRLNRTSMSGNIIVFLRGGEYNYANRYTIRQ